MKLNDALGKVDGGLETLLKKIEKQGTDLNPEIDLRIETLNGMLDRDEFIKNFTWDDTKFPRTRSLIDTAATIQERVKKADFDMKSFIDEYSEANAQLNSLQKSKGANFLTTDLSEVIYGKVDKKMFVPEDSKFLVNLLVVVP
jgi:hypothetical protein